MLDHEQEFQRTKVLPSSTKYTIAANILRSNLQMNIARDLNSNSMNNSKAVTFAMALGLVGDRAKRITKSDDSYKAWLITHFRYDIKLKIDELQLC